jgi:hypothetical protein
LELLRLEVDVASAPDTLPIPEGYKLYERSTGARGPNFFGDPAQLTFVFKRHDERDAEYPLVVAVGSDASRQLVGTEGRAGVPVGVAGADKAAYHDGMWAVGPGLDQRVSAGTVIHWETGDAHSVTAYARGKVVGVRGARSRAVDIGDLVAIAASLVA